MPLKPQSFSSDGRWSPVDPRALSGRESSETRGGTKREQAEQVCTVLTKQRFSFPNTLSGRVSYPEWVNSAQEPEEERKWRREANLHLITKSFSLPSAQILTPCLRHVASWQRVIGPLLLLKTFTLANWCSRSHWAIVLFTFWMNPNEMCSCAAVQLCNCAIVWLLTCTVKQLCRCADV